MNKINNIKTNTGRKIYTISNAFFNKQIELATNGTLNFFSNQLKEKFYPTIDFGTNRQLYTAISDVVKRASKDAQRFCNKNGDLKHNKNLLLKIDNMNAYMFIRTADVYNQMTGSYPRFYITFLGIEAYKAKIKFINTINYVQSYAQNNRVGINTLYLNKNKKTPSWEISYKTVTNKGLDEIFSDTDISYINRFLKEWKSNRDLYEQLNIIHKTGILLYGAPGTGKTSISKAIAKELDIGLYVVNMGDFNEEQIERIKIEMDDCDEDTSVILLEDIDCVFSTRNNLKTENQQKAAQLLLQFLDGVFSIPNTIFIATTNHIEDLDPALIRDGRFDIKLEMKNLSNETAKRMCEHFKLSEEEIKSLLDNETFPINPAYLQNKIVTHIIERSKNVTP